jgi:hypothetical protein
MFKKLHALLSGCINRLLTSHGLLQEPNVQKKSHVALQLVKTQICPIHNVGLQAPILRHLQNLSHNVRSIPALMPVRHQLALLQHHSVIVYDILKEANSKKGYSYSTNILQRNYSI